MNPVALCSSGKADGNDRDILTLEYPIRSRMLWDTMRKLALISALTLSLGGLAAATSAEAGPRGHGYGHGGYGHGHAYGHRGYGRGYANGGRRRGIGTGAAVGLGIAGLAAGAIAAGAARDSYYRDGYARPAYGYGAPAYGYGY
jgi:hypothetical protein